MTIQLTPNELKQIVEEAVYKAAKAIKEQEPIAEDDTLLTRKQVALLLGLSERSVSSYAKKGILKGYRLAGLLRFKRYEIDEAIKKMRV